MPETLRQIPSAPAVPALAVGAATACALAAAAVAAGGATPTAAGAAALGLAGLWLALRGAARGRARLYAAAQERVDALGREAERHRREEARLRAEASALAAARDESEAARRRAESSDRAKAAFLSSLSREIRTPLNNVLGMSGILLDTRLSASQEDYARTIHASAEVLLAIVDDVLDLSRLDEGGLQLDRRDFELSYCIESAVETCAARARDRALALDWQVDPSVPTWLVGDRGRVRHLLLVLLERAVERSIGSGAALYVREVAREDASIVLRFEVADSGPPLAADERERLFQEFPAAPAAPRGLCLAVARRLARLMGGDTGADSTRHGNVLWFTARFGLCTRGAPPAAEEGGELFGLRVLLCDADPESEPLARACVRAMGAELDVARTATEGLEAFRAALAQGRGHAALLVDAELPDLPGRDLGEIVKAMPEARNTGCVLLRRSGDSERPTDLARAGFGAWLSKPFSETRLRTALLHATAEPVGRGSGRAGVEARRRLPRVDANVLLVEDNLVNQRVTALQLEQLGCRVAIASSGMQAIEAVMASDFDLVLMDCLMPEMNGYDATRAIRKLTDPVRRDVPIVAMTAGATRADRDACRSAGMDDHLAKPVRIEQLARLVQHWAHRAEPARDLASPNDDHARRAAAAAERAADPSPRRTGDQLTSSTMHDNDSPPLDAEVISSLRDLGGDDASVFVELVDLFLEDTPPRIAALEAAVESGSAAELEAAAHALKSSCGNLGAMRLSEMFRDLEAYGRSADVEAAASLVAQSRQEFRRVEEALRKEIA